MKNTSSSRVWVGLLVSLVVLGAASEDCQARLAGTVSVGSDLTFTSQSQSVWGPDQSLEGLARSFDLFKVSVPKTSASYGEKVSLWGGSFGGVLKPSLEWSMGMTGSLYDFDSGAVKLEWPATVTLTMDEPNSYGPGDTVTIDSQYRVLDSGYLTATPPLFKVDLKGKFSLDFSASLQGCLGTCGTYNIFPNRSFNGDFTLLRLSNGGLSFPDIPAQRSYAVPHLMSWCESAVTSVGGYLDFPNGYPHLPGTTAYIKACSDASAPVDFSGDGEAFDIKYSAVPKREGNHQEVFQQETSYRFMDISVDLDGFVDPTDLLGNDTPTVAGISGSYDLLDLSSDLNLTYRQALRFDPSLEVRIDFPRAMTFKITGGEWQTAASALFAVGQSLELKVPADQSEPWTNSTLYNLDNVFTSTTKIEPRANLNYSAARIEAHLPAVSNFAENVMKQVCYCPDWDVTGVICLVSKVCDYVVDHVNYHDYGKVDISEAFVDGKEIAGLSSTIQLHSYTGTLGGISPRGGTPVNMDPENPQLELAAEVSRVINHGAGKRTVIYTMTVNNSGDVPLKDLNIADSLADAFAGAKAFSLPDDGLRSCDLTVNRNFSSATGGELLLSPVILDDGRDPNPGPVSQITSGTVQVEVDVWPGLYPRPFLNNFRADGASWIRGTAVSREAQTALELGPARLENLKDFAVYADKKVLMKEPALIKGSVGSNDAVEIQNGGNTLIAGDIRSLGTVDVHGAVTLDYIFTNSLLNLGESGRVNGHRYFEQPKLKEVNEYVTPVMQGFELPALAIESDGPSLTITTKSGGKLPYVLAPGEYGAVTVAAGAKVLFKSAEDGKNYSFRDLNIEEGATILFDVSAGALAVNVAHGMKIGQNVKMVFDHPDGSSRDVDFNIASRGQIKVGQNAQITGTWLAPSASITLGANSRLTGAVYSDMIKMETGSRVEFHEEPWIGNIYKSYNLSCESKASVSNGPGF